MKGAGRKVAQRNPVWERVSSCEPQLNPASHPNSPFSALMPLVATTCWDETGSADVTHHSTFSGPHSPDYTCKDQE